MILPNTSLNDIVNHEWASELLSFNCYLCTHYRYTNDKDNKSLTNTCCSEHGSYSQEYTQHAPWLVHLFVLQPSTLCKYWHNQYLIKYVFWWIIGVFFDIYPLCSQTVKKTSCCYVSLYFIAKFEHTQPGLPKLVSQQTSHFYNHQNVSGIHALIHQD